MTQLKQLIAKSPVIMGIVNVTPDSFSDGGKFLAPEKAVSHALELIEEGADILDIGGESTRPGASPVSPQEETDRILPVIEGLKNCRAVISVDTRHAETMKAALAAGAAMINDVMALMDAGCRQVAANCGGPVCLMHMKGSPQTMQENPKYNDVVEDVFNFLAERISACEKEGIAKERLIVDPGIGFGKTREHNLTLLKNLTRFHDLGVPVLLGASRKSFIGGMPPQQRVEGSIAAALAGLKQGVQIFRVHDVAETKKAFEVFDAGKT